MMFEEMLCGFSEERFAHTDVHEIYPDNSSHFPATILPKAFAVLKQAMLTIVGKDITLILRPLHDFHRSVRNTRMRFEQQRIELLERTMVYFDISTMGQCREGTPEVTRLDEMLEVCVNVVKKSSAFCKQIQAQHRV